MSSEPPPAEAVLTVLRETPGERPLRFVSAADFAAVSEPASEPLATDADGGAVIPAGGLVLLYGSGGAGKTTLAIDLCVHLATGRRWLELVSPVRPLRVALIENEGPRAMFREKLARKLETWPDAGENVLVLEEPWHEANFRDESQRDELVRFIDAEEIDLLIVGPVTRVGMQGGGTLDEIKEFVDLIDDVQRRCERAVAVGLVHHENRAGQVSGAWEAFPDTLVHVQAQGHGRTRLYWQKLRWSSTLHGTSTNLAWADAEGFEVEEREEVTEASIADAIVATTREHPGLSWTKLRELNDEHGQKRIRGRGETAQAVRDRLISDGLLVNGATTAGQFRLWVADDPAAPVPAWERVGNETRPASPDGVSDPTRSPFPSYKGTGERERVDGPGLLVDDPLFTEGSS